MLFVPKLALDDEAWIGLINPGLTDQLSAVTSFDGTPFIDDAYYGSVTAAYDFGMVMGINNGNSNNYIATAYPEYGHPFLCQYRCEEPNGNNIIMYSKAT